jgi:alanine racemase
MTSPLFPSWLEVDLDAVEANVHWLQRTIGPGCRIAAVVKAQAYGLGAEEISRAAVRGGASQLAVARVHEGVALRRAGLTEPILILSAIVPSEASQCCRYDLTPTVVDPSTVALLNRVAEGLGRALPVHLKVDTGLTRYGATLGTAVELAQQLGECEWLIAEGLYTHFASSDGPTLDFTYEQVQRFNDMQSHLSGIGLHFPTIHASNTGAAIRVPEARFDMVRIGIALSGYAPSPEVCVDGVKPAAALKASLARVYDLEPGTTVGYGRTFSVLARMRAGLVPLGYADGIPRAFSNRGAVLIRGRRALIIGRVSMDQCVVDLSGIPEAREGDEVVAMGPQADAEISLDEFAEAAYTIPHEALCRLGPRLPRVYRRGGEISRVVVFEGADADLECGE